MDLIHTKNPLPFLEPNIIKLGHQQFRRLCSETNKNDSIKKLTPYLDNDDSLVNCMELEDDVEIKLTKSGKFMTYLHVAEYFYGAIIGMKGSKRKEIEMDTGTSIKIPKQNEEGDILVTGASERDVITARNRIQMIVLKMRDSHTITHFVSIPVVSEQIKKNLEIFKMNLLNGPPLRGVDESIFQNPDKLHLTIATLVLLDDVEKELAIRTLHECKEEITNFIKASKGLKIVLEGLEIMNDDPSDVHVLYGKVKVNLPKYNSSFQKIADYIAKQYSKKGLIRNQYESVKLHVTLMNSMFRRTGNEQSKRESFDSSYILTNFKNFYFGEAAFDTIQLSIRFSSGADKYYEALTVITLE